MISGGTSTFTTVHPFRSDLGDGFRMMSIFWLCVGLVFFLVAVFGIFVAFKESPVLAGLVKRNINLDPYDVLYSNMSTV